MRTTFYCLLIAGALRLAFDATSQEVIIPTQKMKHGLIPQKGEEKWLGSEHPEEGWKSRKVVCADTAITKHGESLIESAKPKWTTEPRCLIIAGGVSGAWLTINRADVHGYEQRGFDPSYTYLLSDPKPIVKKLPNGKWQIEFVSEIAEKLP